MNKRRFQILSHAPLNRSHCFADRMRVLKQSEKHD